MAERVTLEPERRWLAKRISVPWWGFAIAAFQILGGLSCLGSVMVLGDRAVRGGAKFPVGPVSMFVVSTVFAALSVIAIGSGVLLLMQRDLGWRASRLIQAMQLVQFDMLGVKYVFVLGASVTAGVKLWDLTYGWHVGSDAALLMGGTSAPFWFAINGVAMITFAALLSRSPETDRGVQHDNSPAG